MMKRLLIAANILLSLSAPGATSISQFGITWMFDQDCPVGQYANGDYWVAGPVNIISISNSFHTNGIVPETGTDGCMINPGGTDKQGYDCRLSNYQSSLNRSYPGGSPVSVMNPLVLNENSSLISAVSWLVGEPGCPKIGSAGGPRPSIRSMAILTCVSNAPFSGSFRPPYCGSNKEPKFNISQLDYSRLANLSPVSNTPSLATIEGNFTGPWVDHVNNWVGEMTRPSIHMPSYGRDLSLEIGEAALMLQLDFSQLPGNPDKETLLVRFVQLGIDFAGIADVGGGWPSNGGHDMGRKWPILFAGAMLNDAHMKNVGSWDTDFQEDLDTFYVSQAEVDLTHSPEWKPDTRAAELWPYEVENIGLPEWGIAHTAKPQVDNLHWSAVYRQVNHEGGYVGWVLAANIMGLRADWNHEPLFDYTDRFTSIVDPQYTSDSQIAMNIFGGYFLRNMWKTYRGNYLPQWVPNNPADVYGQGQRLYPLRFTAARLLPDGSTGMGYSQTLAVSGGTAPYTWEIASGSLPPGLGLISSSGSITGTPTTVDTAGFDIRVTDTAGRTTTNAFVLTIATADSDGIPDEWKTHYFGNATNTNPSSLAANGVNTIYETYIAGLDPTNPASVLLISGFQPLISQSILQWTAVSGRVYSVYWTTNLLNGFQPLETNILWPQNSWTDTVHGVQVDGFYKIKVQLGR